MGGIQVQINVVDSKTLEDAKKNPQMYKELIVRVWGFSTYFITLPEEYQNHIIARTEHGC
jgi:pyruvate-formate lyase